MFAYFLNIESTEDLKSKPDIPLRLLYTANSDFYAYKEPTIPKPSVKQTTPPSIPIDLLYPAKVFPVGMEIPYYMSDGKTLRNIHVASAKAKEELDEDAYQVGFSVKSGCVDTLCPLSHPSGAHQFIS